MLPLSAKDLKNYFKIMKDIKISKVHQMCLAISMNRVKINCYKDRILTIY